MPATKRGIYHNLKESKYTISNKEIVFFFSSELYLNKFIEGYETHRMFFLDKLEKLTGETPLNMETLADIAYYVSVEKRGFRAWLKGVDINWEDLNNYALRKMTEEESPSWTQIPKPTPQTRYKSVVHE